MNIDTGELCHISPKMMELIKKEFDPDDRWHLVPDALQHEAERQFQIANATGDSGGTVRVDLDGKSPLSKWAAEKRAEQDHKNSLIQKRRQKQKNRRKATKQSRSRNRR